MDERGKPGVRLTGITRLQQRLDPWLKGPLRSLARLVYRPLARGRPVLIEIDGQAVRFSFGSQPPVRDGVLGEEQQIFVDAIKAGDTVFDVGCHHGTMALLAALRVGPSGRVFAFEPTAESRVIIAHNIELNGYHDRIELLPKVAGDRAGTVDFFMSESDSTNALFAPSVAQTGFTKTTVEMITLDSLAQSSGRSPNVVKMDVEGAEFGVLRGAPAIVRSAARIFFEIHPYAWPQAGHSATDLTDWLTAHGRRMVWLGTDDPVTEVRYGNTELVPLR